MYGESAVSDGAGHIYTFGGVGANGTITNIVYRYTIATNTWDQVAPMPGRRARQRRGARPERLDLRPGRQDGRGHDRHGGKLQHRRPTPGRWKRRFPRPVSSEAAAVDSLGRIEVLGGYDANGNPLASISVSQELTQPDLAPTITSSPGKSASSSIALQLPGAVHGQPAGHLRPRPGAGRDDDQREHRPDQLDAELRHRGHRDRDRRGQQQRGPDLADLLDQRRPADADRADGRRHLPRRRSSLSWNASTDPNVTSYDVYRRTFAPRPRGSGGTYHYA